MLDYTLCNLNDLKLEIKKDGNDVTKTLVLGGNSFKTTDRFWASISSRFGLSQKLFKFFTPEEVLTRVMEVSKKDKKGVAIRLVTDGKNVYGTSDPATGILEFNDISTIFKRNNIDFSFVDGQLQSFITPDGGNQLFDIGGDKHSHRFFLRSPVDGYGNHTGAVALYRQVCENGLVAMAPAFTTILKIGKGDKHEMEHGLNRAINSFNNSDGYRVLEHRVEMAQKSNASIAEVHKIKSLVEKLDENGDLGFLSKGINKASNHSISKYGITDVRELGKRAKILPADCTMYDMINVLTESATHHISDISKANKIHGLVGTLLSTEYDLEGTKSKFSEFRELFFDKKEA